MPRTAQRALPSPPGPGAAVAHLLASAPQRARAFPSLRRALASAQRAQPTPRRGPARPGVLSAHAEESPSRAPPLFIFPNRLSPPYGALVAKTNRPRA
jgi:hypothetical protein